MKLNVSKEHADLSRLSIRELRVQFAEVFGETTLSGNRTWLIRRILWRWQALAEGGLSERARLRAEELANEADLRMLPPRPSPRVDLPSPRQEVPDAEPALPMPGTVLSRLYKGDTLHVQVLTDGFAFRGQTYRSLSAVAKAITGSHCSGLRFFGLQRDGGGR
jgi:hypothetical protein